MRRNFVSMYVSYPTPAKLVEVKVFFPSFPSTFTLRVDPIPAKVWMLRFAEWLIDVDRLRLYNAASFSVWFEVEA